jgi:hypothetical protein
VEGENWQSAALGPEEALLALDPGVLVESGVFGAGVRIVHRLLKREEKPTDS